MDDQRLEELSEIYKALADKNRLKILQLLRKHQEHPLCVNALARSLEISQPAVSQHLKILKQQGLISVKKEGYYKHYGLDPKGMDYLENLKRDLLG